MPETTAITLPSLDKIHAKMTELSAWHQKMQADGQTAFRLI